MRLTLCLLIASLAVPFAAKAANPGVPAAGELLRQLEGATPNEQKQTLKLLKQHHGTTLDADCQRRLLALVISAHVSEWNNNWDRAIQIWAAAPDSWENCRTQIEALKAAVLDQKSTETERAMPLIHLLLIGSVRRDKPEIPELFFQMLLDRTESAGMRGSSASLFVMGNLAAPRETSETLLKLMADRDEDPDLRAFLVGRLSEFYLLLPPHDADPLAKLLIAIGTSPEESVELRQAALVGFSSLMSGIRMNDLLAQFAAFDLLQQSLTYAADWRAHLNAAIAEIKKQIAGSRVERSSVPVKRVSHTTTDNMLGDLSTEILTHMLQIYNQRLCHPNGSTYGYCRESSGRLLSLLSDRTTDRIIREAAGHALRFSLAIDERLIPALIDMLRAEEEFLRPLAAEILAERGADARPSIPTLIALWNDEREPQETRNAAGRALRQLDLETAERLGIPEIPAVED